MSEHTPLRERSTQGQGPAPGRLLQRKCECGQHTPGGGSCGGCESKKRLLQRRASPEGERAGEAAPVPASVHETLRSSGQPLDAGTRSFMESRFGHDFSHVRVHTDARAAESASAVGALAYTAGRDVVFGAGQYAPGRPEGRRLLAHELTHVLQQGGRFGGTTLALGDADAAAEHEAERVAAQVTAEGTNAAAPSQRAERPMISRDARPTLRRWKVTGNTATSDSDFDTLGGLAKKAGAHFNDWKCIKPIKQRTSTLARPPANFNSRYELYVQKGDEFDISNLTATTGTSLRIYLFDDATEAMDAAIAGRFYPGSVSSLDADTDFDSTANSGSNPISELLIFGHAHGDTMWGGASSFTPSGFNPEEPVQSFTLASTGLFPRRCWFTRNATARSVGCNSDAWGQDFASHYLRDGASVTTTTASVRPKCSAPLVDAAGNCTAYDGLDFASSPAATAPALGGPYWNVGDFHAGGFWLTINGKL